MQQVATFENGDGSQGLSVAISDSLREVLDVFRRNPSMRILAVVDTEQKPIGVIREVDVRNLLFNPFGHALMSNPGFGKDIHNLIKPCATAEQTADSARLIGTYSQHPGSPGLLLTIGGKFLLALSDNQLLELMSEGRVSRAEKITVSSEAFTDEIISLSGQLSKAASSMKILSDSLGQQAEGMTAAAQEVAAGAAQSATGLQDVKERGRHLADALEKLASVASDAKLVRVRTQDVLAAAEPQMDALVTSGAEIGNIIDVIHRIGRTTNFLALNAQIEAARDETNSHGFVAVAGEIKQLASQTKGSAEEVSRKVDRIGTAVTGVLSGHREIVSAMDSISQISGQIETAVDEQSATSLVIAGFVEQAADATEEISARASDIGRRAHQVQSSARELEKVSSMLQTSATGISTRSREFVASIQYA